MNIVCRVAMNVGSEEKKALRKLGYDPSLGFQVFEIDESTTEWEAMRILVDQFDLHVMYETNFSSQEIDDAQYLCIESQWHHGYPQPEDDYEELTYKIVRHEDGLRIEQNAPFRMKGEPKWGRRHIMQLNWEFDVFFCLPDIWSSVFKPFGVEYMPVLNKKGKTLETVVQLVSQGISPVALLLDGYRVEISEKLKRERYYPITRGFFPPLADDVNMHYFQSKEYFGSGAENRTKVIISHALYAKMVESKLRGVLFYPLKWSGKVKGSEYQSKRK